MVSDDTTVSHLTGYIAKTKRVSATLSPEIAITETDDPVQPPNTAAIVAPTTALFDGNWSGRKMDGVMRDPNLGATSALSLTQVSTDEDLDASSCEALLDDGESVSDD
jgi:hypothetical protein